MWDVCAALRSVEEGCWACQSPGHVVTEWNYLLGKDDRCISDWVGPQISELAFLHVTQPGSLREDKLPRVESFYIGLEAKLGVRVRFTLNTIQGRLGGSVG